MSSARPRYHAPTIGVLLALAVGCEPRSFRPASVSAKRVVLCIAEDSPSPGARPARLLNSTTEYHLLPNSGLTSGDFEQVRIFQGDSGSWVVSIEFRPAAAVKLANLTRSHVGKRLALAINDLVVMAPKIQGPWKGPFVIDMSLDEEEARNAARALAGHGE